MAAVLLASDAHESRMTSACGGHAAASRGMRGNPGAAYPRPLDGRYEVEGVTT